MTIAERKAEQQSAAIAQMEADEAVILRNGRPTALTMLALHDAETGRGLTTVTLDELRAELRAGPGPDRPRVHGAV